MPTKFDSQPLKLSGTSACTCLLAADLDLRCPHMPEDTFSHGAAHIIRTSIARTPMAHLPWLIRTRFLIPTKFFRWLKETNIKGIVLLYHEIVCCEY